jgi:hypothetical protein
MKLIFHAGPGFFFMAYRVLGHYARPELFFLPGGLLSGH